jgi:hypothetical protein
MRRTGHHRDPADRLPRPRHPGRGVGQRAWRQGFRLRLDHRPAGRHHQLHPRLSGLLRQHCAGRQGQDRAGRGLRPQPQRPVHRHQGPRRLPERAPHPREQAHPAQGMPDLHRLPLPPGRQLQELPGHDGRRDAAHRRPAPPRRRRAGPGLCGGRLTDGFFETGLSSWDVAAARCW